MMNLRRKQDNAGTPPIYADLLIETPAGKTYRVDMDAPGWLKEVRPLMDIAPRIGLVLRGNDRPSVWISTNGDTPEYLSRVIGTLSMQGTEHRKTRVAGLICGETSVWLHRDGLVEVQPEPTAWR